MHPKYRTVDDRVLEVESGEVVPDANAVRDGEVPVLPEPLAVVKDDALAKVVRRVADELEAAPEGFAVRDRLLVPTYTSARFSSRQRADDVHVQDPVVDPERDVVAEVVECARLVLGLTCGGRVSDEPVTGATHLAETCTTWDRQCSADRGTRTARR